MAICSGLNTGVWKRVAAANLERVVTGYINVSMERRIAVPPEVLNTFVTSGGGGGGVFKCLYASGTLPLASKDLCGEVGGKYRNRTPVHFR